MSADRISAKARAYWLLLRDGGGWWSPGEVAGAIDAKAGYPGAAHAARALGALHAREHVELRRAPDTGVRYGVTARCIPIDGETLEPA